VRFPRPRSLTSLLLLGLALVSLPLLAGVLFAALQMNRLSDSSERIVQHGVQATGYTQAVVRQIAAMERSARFYQVLGRADLLEVVRENASRIETNLQSLETLPGSTQRETVIAEIRATIGRIDPALASGNPSTMAKALAEFSALSQAGGQLSVQAGRQIDRELNALQEQTRAARRLLIWQSAALAPLTVFLALLVALLLGRPIRAIDTAISDLGNGRLDNPVQVRGPADLEALGRQLEWLRLRLREVSEERERFLRHMSHELKTPLANIREGTELLLDGSVGALLPQQQEVGQILQENAVVLQRLIENLLSYSAWQSQSTTVQPATFRLRPLIQSVLNSHQLAIAGSHLRLDADVQDLTLTADRGKLRLIVENLVSNAIKFTPDGGTVYVRARSAGDDWVLEVADTGPGVPIEDRTRIFEPFFSGQRPERGYLHGTGIGLSVVQEFVSAHGGRIEVVNGQYPGAHFRVVLPVTVPLGFDPDRRISSQASRQGTQRPTSGD